MQAKKHYAYSSRCLCLTFDYYINLDFNNSAEFALFIHMIHKINNVILNRQQRRLDLNQWFKWAQLGSLAGRS